MGYRGQVHVVLPSREHCDKARASFCSGFCCSLRRRFHVHLSLPIFWKRYGIILVPVMQYRFVGFLMMGYTLRGFEKFMAVW